MSDEERRLAAIMFSDIVGYSALAQRNEPLALELLEEHRRLLRPLFPKHDGREIKTMADGTLIEFSSALQAVYCAIEMQKVVVEHNASCSPERKFEIRIGLHVGDVIHREGDLLGDVVNIAARVQPCAEASGICITEQVYDQVHNKLEVVTVRVGKKELKNIQTPMELYRIVLPWQQKPRDSPQVTSVDDGAAKKSIAVLPFVNMSPDPENEYFSDGITEEILTQLTKIRDLKVISRTSVMHFKNTTETLQEIGRKLGVATVLEGSVRKAGNRVRIAAQLINTQIDRHLWAETYDRELSDIFAIQSEVAQEIAQALKAQVTTAEKERIEKVPTENLEAYQLYLKGRYFWNKRTEEGLKKGLGFFQQAIEKDPNYALAYAGLADSYNMLGHFGLLPPKETYPRAKAAAVKALEIDIMLAEAHNSLAFVGFAYDWDWSAAESEFQRALQLNPAYATAHQWYAYYLLLMGRHDEFIAEIKRAQDLDPITPIVTTAAGNFFYYARQYDQAIEQCRKALEMEPSFFWAHGILGLAYVQKGVYEEAITEFQKAEALSGGDIAAVAVLGCGYGLSSKRGEALKILDEFKERSTQEYVSPFCFAQVYTGLGEKDQAFEWLQKAYEERESLGDLKVDPMFDSLRSDPRFTELLKKMGLAD